MAQKQTDLGSMAVPRFYLKESRPEHKAVKELFDRIDWPQERPRADFLGHRFNAFCTILTAVRSDKDHIVHTLLNKSHYDVSDWPIPYRAIKDVMDALKRLGWLKRHGERKLHRNFRFIAPPNSPLLTCNINTIQLSELDWEPPIVSIRRGVSDLDRSPLDVEWMMNPQWKKWIAKHLTPRMEDLNDKLLSHEFVLFPFGKRDEWVQPQYQRIYTNLSGFREEPRLSHGRIYPRNFYIPSKKEGWRQMTLIDGQPTVEVDVHASSLTLLSNDYYLGFDLPDTDDYYQFGPLAALKRDLVKAVVQALINGVSYDYKGWPPSFKKDMATKIEGENWSDYAIQIVTVYPALAQVRPNMGMDLMLEESDIIIKAMNELLDKGIGCLSLHDCLIVPEANTEDAKIAFYTAYAAKGNKKPLVRVERSAN